LLSLYQVYFDGVILTSGDYFYTMVPGDYSVVKKMDLLK